MSTGAGYRSYAGDDMVTGEGVAVELPVAGRPLARRLGPHRPARRRRAPDRRVVPRRGSSSAAPPRPSSGTVSILLVVAVTVGVPTVVETLTRGRTLGKLALGLRVVRDDGGPITARHALTRALVGVRRDLPAGRRRRALVAATDQPAGQAARRHGGRHLCRRRSARRMRLLPAAGHATAAGAVGAPAPTWPRCRRAWPSPSASSSGARQGLTPARGTSSARACCGRSCRTSSPPPPRGLPRRVRPRRGHRRPSPTRRRAAGPRGPARWPGSCRRTRSRERSVLRGLLEPAPRARHNPA